MIKDLSLEGIIWNDRQDILESQKKSKIGVIWQSMETGKPEVWAMDFSGNKVRMNTNGEHMILGSYNRGLVMLNNEDGQVIMLDVDGTKTVYNEDKCLAVRSLTVPVIKTFTSGFSATLSVDRLGMYFMDGSILEMGITDIALLPAYTPFNKGIARLNAEKSNLYNEIIFETITETENASIFAFATGKVSKTSILKLSWDKGDVGIHAIKDGIIYEDSFEKLEYIRNGQKGEIPYGKQDWKPISEGAVMSQEFGKKLEWTCRTIDGAEWKMRIDEPYTWWHAYG